MRLVTTKYQMVCNTLFVMFWVLATYNFVVQEATRSEQPVIELLVRLAAQGVLVVLGLWTIRSQADKWIIAVFGAFTFVSTVIVNHQSVGIWVDGIRLYVGFLFVVPILRYLIADPMFHNHFVARMDKTLFRFLILQTPCLLLQVVRYHDRDLAGGSLGWMMSGVISNLIYLISFYLMLRRWKKDLGYLQNIKRNCILLVLLLPTFLNETKVSFVFVLMYFFFLIPMDKKFIGRLILFSPLIIGAFFAGLYIYASSLGGVRDMASQATVAQYIVGDDAALNMVENIFDNNEVDVGQDFARGLKFAITPAIMNRNPVSWICGYGIGQYKVGDSAKKVPFAKRYQWLLSGTMIQGHVIWLEMGIGGLILYFIFWIVLLRIGRKSPSRNLQLQWFLGINILVVTVYNAPMFVIPYCIIFLFLTLISSDWKSLPPAIDMHLLGSRPFRWNLRRSRQ